MAEVTKKTERIETVIYENKDVIDVRMSAEEAHAVYSALWLMKMVNMGDPNYVAIKDVQNALGVALDFPATKLRFNKNDHYNNGSSVYVYSCD